jgi:hypothetical protein
MIIPTLKPATTPSAGTSHVEPSEPAVPVQAEPKPKKLVPNATQYFDNDLDDEDKQKILDSFLTSAKAVLAEDKVTVNSVAKLFSLEHNRVKKGWETSCSLKRFYESRSDSTDLAKVKRSIARLSPEERELLRLQLEG